ncbi:MAG: hypothetical protein ACJA2S_003207 [Cyclobacteriaceae bacterium]|jgi:hypothetical protein
MAMDELHEYQMNLNRREFLSKTSLGLGAAALSSILPGCGINSLSGLENIASQNTPSMDITHFAPKAKRIIYLFQSGAPSQIELFDPKPVLRKMFGEELPESVRKGQRLTGMTSGQDSFPLAGSYYDFQQKGKSGTWFSDILPHIGEMADELCVIKSMHTEAINHGPATSFFQTGHQQPGRPSIGSWLSYGLGSMNEDLPTFSVLLSRGTGRPNAQPLYSRLWGNGFLPSLHQGVQFRSGADPVLYLNDLPGITKQSRRRMLDHIAELNHAKYEENDDPEILTRIAQYEMAYRMQTSVPETMDISKEPDEIFDLYGPNSRIPGTYAANCILARRMAEKDVRFTQLYHMGWDQHDNLPKAIAQQCEDVDQPTAALIKDLKRRGLLDDTLVIWGGEFGRTNYCQGKMTAENYGRDHHPRCFSIFMAGGGIKPGMSYGETDDFSYNIIKDPVHVHDFQATVMHLLGIDHEKLTYKHQGRRYRLTDVHGNIIKDILA